ncbi:recombinase zinc beta ribbon domain-containing protein [Synechococcus sp. Tobar12-5m-g]|uniref:recombinase zinc beta ribbon domain-containing protein n=1 Tax=unclassified Synechococcus TaxID=2626047 RepID=UPI0020CCADCE|nr:MULTISPECIES: recombinase zinc beta ribbon domain-containing protein [unclassified Synechococcus]MCP9771638.1 recombinase zinc beta ribbon domain-containing protein [Synechococcus sp. Tobar12-5m-g]
MERQEAALARWLADHPDYELREALVDAGVSAGRGRNRTRGALARFIEGGRSGAVPSGGCLVVESMSRFSREIATTTLRTLLNDVWGAGLAISFCTDGVILDEELIAREDHRLHAVLGAIGQARAEWLERSRRSKGAAARARRSQDEGIRTDGRAPWWLARDPGTGRLLRGEDGTLVLDPDHTRSIRRAVALATAGQGMVLISRRLTEEGFIPPPTWRARNQYGGKTAPEWTAGIFSQLLAHPSLTGTLQRKGAPDLPGYYPAVITDAEHQALRASVQQRDRMKGRLRGLSSQCHNLFQGAIRCALCGGPISYAAASKRARAGHPGYLSCRAARRGAGTCSNTGTILYDQLETHCLTRLSSADWEALLHRPEDDQDRHELEQAAEQLGGERDRLQAQLEQAEHRAEGLWLENASEERQATVERSLARLRSELALAEEQLAEAQQRLAVARSRPSAQEAAAAIHGRVRELWGSIGTATPAERLSFNRWILSRSIEFRVQPKPADGGDRMIEMLVEGRLVGAEPLAPLSRGLARGLALVDPLAQQVTDEGATLIWLRSTGEVGPAVEVAVARMQGEDWIDATAQVRAHRVVVELLDDYRAQGRLDGIAAEQIEGLQERLVAVLLERAAQG